MVEIGDQTNYHSKPPLSEPNPNPHISRLEQQGVNLTIPHDSLQFGNYPEELQIDQLTRLPIENDSLRTFLAGKLSEAVKNNKN